MAGGAGARRKAAVRCCSNDGKKCASRKGRCFGRRKTYQEAVGICAAAGMRLCTQAEVATEMCCRTGCMYDHRQVWTSDSCSTQATTTTTTTTNAATTQAGDFLVVDGCTTEGTWGREKNFGQKCMDAGARRKAAVRCCSNDGKKCASRKGRCFGRRKTYQE